jgi:hypothetical protein
MQFNQLLNRSKELATPRGGVLAQLHILVWDRLKDLRFTDQVWVANNLLSSLQKRQAIHYCRKCRGTNCKNPMHKAFDWSKVPVERGRSFRSPKAAADIKRLLEKLA